MRGLAVDLAPIRINLVSPGVVDTEFYNYFAGEGLEEMMKYFRSETLVGMVGRPEDVAEAYVYAMRDGFVTGSVITSDGGRLLK